MTSIVSDFSAWRRYVRGLMRPLANLLAAFVIGLAMPSVAAPPPHANGHANGADNGNGGESSAGPTAPAPVPVPDAAVPPASASSSSAAPADKAHGEPPGQTKKTNESPDQAKTHDVRPDQERKAGKSGPAGGAAATPDQDAAQSAVERLEALPLAKIIKVAEGRRAGKVINARLLRVSGVLLYQLTRLDDKGKSWRDYYNAATGNPVVLR